jgi:ribosomal protein S18 acetylase RimI-like enzyme
MNKKIDIVSAKQCHYREILRIYNEGFLPKFNFVSKDKEKQRTFMHDFGGIDLGTPDKEFIAIIDGRVRGILSLRYLGQGDMKPAPNLSNWALLRKYGPISIIKAIMLDRAMRYLPPIGELYIDSISVAENGRGQGVGSAMMNYADALALKKGLDTVSLRVMFENPRAKALYERCGFSEVSTTVFPFLKKTTGYSGAFFMVKDLKQELKK